MPARPNHRKPFCFLSFPREIRDQIYDESLLAEKTYAKRNSSYHLNLAILLTCHQVNAEARESLYERNGWIRIREYGQHLTRLLGKLHLPHLQLFMVKNFTGTPLLDMSLRHNRLPGTSIDHLEHISLISMSRFHDVCLALAYQVKSEAHYECINVIFHRPSQQNTTLQTRLLKALSYVYGFEQANTMGLSPAMLGLELKASLTNLHPAASLQSPMAKAEYHEEIGNMFASACKRRTATSRKKRPGLSRFVARVQYVLALKHSVSLIDDSMHCSPAARAVNDHIAQLWRKFCVVRGASPPNTVCMGTGSKGIQKLAMALSYHMSAPAMEEFCAFFSTS
ncbi:MAG: hypothetical protein Q9222_003952 [Ikaeria aurantiellina]